MAETATAPAPEKPQTLDDVMIAMDVVDTLRHREDLVHRELNEEGREAELIARLRKIYSDQGIAVSDRLLADGVKALKDSRFVYAPAPRGWRRSLFTLWARRATYAKVTGVATAVLLAGWIFYDRMVAAPARLGAEQTRIEFSQTLPKALQQAHADVVAVAAADPIAKQKADALLADGTRALRDRDRAGVLKANAQLAALREQFRGAQAAGQSLRQVHAEVLAIAVDNAAKQKASALLEHGERLARAGDKAGADKAAADLQTLKVDLAREYALIIVSRPGEPTLVRRRPPRSTGSDARNHYVIVEAVAPDGSKLSLSIRSEEDGTTKTVTKFGMRIPQEVYEAIAKDKRDDGIVQRNRFGVKRRGVLEVEYLMPFEGGYITSW
jgi:hypothetical protein